MFVTYPDACWCQLITIDDRIEALPIRMRVDPRCGAAHDRSDEPRTHASAGPTPQRRFHKLRRGLQSGGAEKQLVLSSSERLKPGQNSPCSTHPHPNRDKTLPAQAKRPEFHVFGRAGGILSRKCPNVRALGEFCHGHAPKSARLANFVTDMPRSSSTGHVLSGHKLYARTFTHWLIRPPATPSMGRHHTRGQRGLAAVPVGGGGAWPGFEIDHSEPKARVWRSRGRAAAHGHTQQPGGCTSTQSSPAVATGSPRAHTAARRLHEHTKQPGRGHGQPTGTHSSPAAARAHNEAATGFPATAS